MTDERCRVQALSAAEQSYRALQERSASAQAEYERASEEHERQTQQWMTRHDQQLNHSNSLQTQLTDVTRQLHDNRHVS